MLCGAVSWSEMVTTSPRAKELDNASFSVIVDDSLTSLQWLISPPPCDIPVPGASGRGSQPGGGPARRREPPLSAHHHQTHPVISCRQPVSSSRVPLSPLAADPAPPFQTMTLACSLTQKSLPGIVSRGTRGKRPPYTYPMMICMAMQASRKSKIATSCIYQWFMDSFPYFRHHDKPDSWKSSIRHNLSTIKEFISVSRQGDDPGKGGFWTVDPQYAEGILLRALDKWISDYKRDPSLASPLVQIPLLPSPLPVSSLQTDHRPCNPTGGQSVSQQLIRGFDDVTSVEQKQPGKEIGKLKRKKRPDSTATMAKVPRRSSSLVLQTEEPKELDGLLDWVLSRELSPILQQQPLSTSPIEDLTVNWDLDVVTGPIEDDLTVNFDCDLDLLDSTLSGELGLYSEEPLSSTSPIEKDVIVTFDFDWDALLGSALREEQSVDSGEPSC